MKIKNLRTKQLPQVVLREITAKHGWKHSYETRTHFLLPLNRLDVSFPCLLEVTDFSCSHDRMGIILCLIMIMLLVLDMLYILF
jgi:hypothetical protein